MQSKTTSLLDEIIKPDLFDGSDIHDDDTLTPDERHFEVLRRDQIIRAQEEEIERCKDEHKLRKHFLTLVFWLVVLFVIVTLLIVVLSNLSDKVLITLLTTTTANVIGILLIAFKWLFPTRSN